MNLLHKHYWELQPQDKRFNEPAATKYICKCGLIKEWDDSDYHIREGDRNEKQKIWKYILPRW